MTVSQDDDGRIWIDQVPKGIMVEMGEQPERTELVHYDGDSLIPVKADRGMYLPHAFVGDDGHGRALYLHVGRAIRRADSPPATRPTGRRPETTARSSGAGRAPSHVRPTVHDGRSIPPSTERRRPGRLARLASEPWVRFAARRLGRLLVSLWVLITASFLMIHLIPGDPVRGALGMTAPPALVAVDPRGARTERPAVGPVRRLPA